MRLRQLTGPRTITATATALILRRLQQGSDQSRRLPPAPPTTLIYLKDGTSYEVMSYWLDAGKLHYITNYGGETTVDMGQLDLQRTVDENARAGVSFTLRPARGSPRKPLPIRSNQRPRQQLRRE